MLRRTGLLAEIGAANIFPSDDAALAVLRARDEGQTSDHGSAKFHAPVERGGSTVVRDHG